MSCRLITTQDSKWPVTYLSQSWGLWLLIKSLSFSVFGSGGAKAQPKGGDQVCGLCHWQVNMLGNSDPFWDLSPNASIKCMQGKVQAVESTPHFRGLDFGHSSCFLPACYPSFQAGRDPQGSPRTSLQLDSMTSSSVSTLVSISPSFFLIFPPSLFLLDWGKEELTFLGLSWQGCSFHNQVSIRSSRSPFSWEQGHMRLCLSLSHEDGQLTKRAKVCSKAS